MASNIKTIPTEDYADVVATVSKYVDGLRVGSAKGVAAAFHKDAVMYGFANGALRGGPVKNLYATIDKSGAAPGIRTRLDVLAITPTTAVVRVDMEKGVTGADCTEFHTLIKIDGTWRTVAKAYHVYEG